MGFQLLLQEVFPAQGSNLTGPLYRLFHWQSLYPLSRRGSLMSGTPSCSSPELTVPGTPAYVCDAFTALSAAPQGLQAGCFYMFMQFIRALTFFKFILIFSK